VQSSDIGEEGLTSAQHVDRGRLVQIFVLSDVSEQTVQGVVTSRGGNRRYAGKVVPDKAIQMSLYADRKLAGIRAKATWIYPTRLGDRHDAATRSLLDTAALPRAKGRPLR
jgi:hypothetical protein